MKANLRKTRGVTLIELLIVMVVIGILAAIAVPSYQRYTVRTYRAAARACLLEAAQYMERFYTTNLTYEGADFQLGCESESNLNTHYTLSIDDATLAQREYTLVADPIGSQGQKDRACQTLTLDQDGARTANGSSDDDLLKQCWR